MTELVRICAAAVLSSALILLIAKREKELAGVISALLYLTVFLYALLRLGDLLDALRARLGGSELPHADVLLRASGVAVLTAAAATLCEENGQRAAGRAVELLGVVELILTAQPIFAELLDFAEKMLLN